MHTRQQLFALFSTTFHDLNALGFIYPWNKCPISFKQLRTVRTASEQLPDLVSQWFRNAFAYESVDLSWALSGVLVPALEYAVPAVKKILINDVLAHNTRATQQRLIIV